MAAVLSKKYHGGLLWTNACCSHPYPGEKVEDAAQRRLQEEMGFSVPDDLSVCVLGHCDVPSEHHHTFSIFGPTAEETISAMTNCIKTRLAHPAYPPQIVHLPIYDNLNSSTASARQVRTEMLE